MFGIKNQKAATMDFLDFPAPQPPLPQAPAQVPRVALVQDGEYRPCWVAGRKALFHRWFNSARPVLPRGMEPGENSRYFQYRSTKAIVEFEDGTVECVWPQDVKFADPARFEEYEWLPAEQEATE